MTPARASIVLALALTAHARFGGAQVPQTGAQQIALTLEQALQMAEQQSEDIAIARAGLDRADGEQLRARSQFFPQLFASAGFTKTLRSQFETFASSGGGDSGNNGPTPPPGPCGQYLLDPTASIVDRLAGVETATRCSLATSAFDGFEDLPFGRENQYDVGLQLSQALYAGGRISAGYDLAQSGYRTAEISHSSAGALLRLTVTEAYYDAALADRLLSIAESALAQTEEALRLTELSRNVGDKSEFELLRARVTRDNQRPAVIQRRSQRELAYLRLKQLLNLPFDAPVQLTTTIAEGAPATGELPVGADTSAASRAAVRLADENVSIQSSLLRIQRAEQQPSVTLSSAYGRVGYPTGLAPSWNDFLENWTVAVGMQVPIFTGGRLRGSAKVAAANVREAQLRLRQTEELAALDARSAVAALRDAEAAWNASVGTEEQATRAYQIAEVRFREGLSTQLELNESRILLQQAQAIGAIAARDLQVARMRLSLLRDLPLGSGSAVPAMQRSAVSVGAGGAGSNGQSGGNGGLIP